MSTATQRPAGSASPAGPTSPGGATSSTGPAAARAPRTSRTPRRPKNCTSVVVDDLDMSRPEPCPNCLHSDILIVESEPRAPKILPASAAAQGLRKDAQYLLQCAHCGRRTMRFASPMQATITWQGQCFVRCRCKRCAHINPTATDYIEYLGDPSLHHGMFQIV